MAKPRSPHMMQVIEDILQTVRDKTAEHNIPIQNATMDIMGDVVDFTGPRRLTRSVYTSLGKILDREIDARDMMELVQPKLVTHHYAGTWKNDNGGEQ